jgi:hypothetical protein
MGHCGRSSYGSLFSLRQVIPINNKYKLNKSVLTAAIGEDGILYQLKGVKNSKPKDEYHQYILPLFYVIGEPEPGEGKLIQGFGTEYASEQDFKLSDLPEQTIKELYQNRPELFSSRPMQRLLDKMGIIEVEPLPTSFTLEISPEDFEDYLDGGWDNTYTNRTTGVSRKVSIFTELMSGEAWDLWGHHDNEDIGSSLLKNNYDTNMSSNTDKITPKNINITSLIVPTDPIISAMISNVSNSVKLPEINTSNFDIILSREKKTPINTSIL